jgi:hypothetical protein
MDFVASLFQGHKHQYKTISVQRNLLLIVSKSRDVILEGVADASQILLRDAPVLLK